MAIARGPGKILGMGGEENAAHASSAALRMDAPDALLLS